MAKAKTIYSCTECGGQTPKWQGQCPGCAQWNTLVESVLEAATPAAVAPGTVAMVRDPQQYPPPHKADVHPAEVANYAAGGWTFA